MRRAALRADLRRRLAKQVHAHAIDSPCIRSCPARAAVDRAAGACRRCGRDFRRRSRRDGAGGLAAGDCRISPQARGISGGARRVRARGRRLLELRSPKSAAAATPSAATISRSTLDDYVLTQPPVYSGPKRPVNPEPPEEPAPPRERKAIPVVADLLQAAAAAFPVHAAAPGQRTRIQARLCARGVSGGTDARAGGAGLFVRDRRQRQPRHAVGLERARPDRARSPPRSATTSCSPPTASSWSPSRAIEFVKALTEKAAQLSGAPRKAMDHKIAVLKRMVAFARIGAGRMEAA